MRKTLITSVVIATLAASGAALAGTVEVTFNDATPFTDVGRSHHSKQQALAALKQHFESLGKRLPDNQRLAIEVTDIDLAGEERWTRNAHDLRVLRGRADWPRIDLRYTLSEGGRTLRQGSDSIADMAYLMTTRGASTDQPYGYERRLITRWFDEKVVAR